MSDKEFTCSACRRTFPKAWSDEEAKAEQEENGWGNYPEEMMAVVCDDCYRKMVAEIPEMLE